VPELDVRTMRQTGEDIRQRRNEREGRLVVALSHFATIVLLPRPVTPYRHTSLG